MDGDLNTRWESAHGVDPSSLVLDFGAPFALVKTRIHWEAANAATYTVDGSLDGISWTTITSRSGGVFGDRLDRFRLSGVYRFVRMNGLTRSVGNAWGYSIWEMEVFGVRPLDLDGDGVDDSIDQCPGTPAGVTVDSTGCEVVVPEVEVSAVGGILVGGAGLGVRWAHALCLRRGPLGVGCKRLQWRLCRRVAPVALHGRGPFRGPEPRRHRPRGWHHPGRL